MAKTEEQIIETVTRLLAKAESTTPAEAEALTAKAEELLARHSIEMAVIDARRKGLGKPEAIVTRWYDVGGIYFQGHQELGFAIGRAFDFKLIQSNWTRTPKMKARFAWVGFESDIAKGELLYTSLLIQCMKALRPFAADWKRDYSYLGSMEGYKARRSFVLGFASTVGARLAAQLKTAAKNAEADAGQHVAACPDRPAEASVALVLADRKQRVKDYYDTKHGDLKASRGRNLSGGVGGYQAGGEAGRSANLGGTSVGTGAKGALGR